MEIRASARLIDSDSRCNGSSPPDPMPGNDNGDHHDDNVDDAVDAVSQPATIHADLPPLLLTLNPYSNQLANISLPKRPTTYLHMKN